MASLARTDSAQVFEGVNTRVVGITEGEVKGVSAYEFYLVDGEISREWVRRNASLARPLIDACCARAARAQKGRLILAEVVVPPLDPDA